MNDHLLPSGAADAQNAFHDGAPQPAGGAAGRAGSVDVDDDLAPAVPGLDQGVGPGDPEQREPLPDDRGQPPALDQVPQGLQAEFVISRSLACS